ncbi:NAD(P)-binding domain-containing protein [Lacticaseibacillus pabuli]|uniref:NAD(P)-binding domain-containing protein n=1 Tax=Lacticaseibacillus pabuli TaxID=3025672 RepID=A0ABY7WTV3_9LACO|nr:NAD(P)-binding domain-containing protein [Lacticaseibacillus sp. KACC 23028]WDF82898.1 NAD(P)-binding domain-containing protein [Lacticaseibacillus sp. KACC 23028]
MRRPSATTAKRSSRGSRNCWEASKMAEPTIGIIGAGKLGSTLARIGTQRGLPILIGSRHSVADLKWIIDTMAPGAVTLSTPDVIKQADIIILAIPLSSYQDLDPKALAGKIVLDATNYWKEVDGTVNNISSLTESSSEVIQNYLADSLVAKAFNHMGYHDLEIEVDRHPDVRRAMAYATDHDEIRPTVEHVLSAFGFDPLDMGPLRFGLLLEPGSPLFGEAIPKVDFEDKIKHIYESDYGKKIVMARGSRIH